MEFSRPEYWSGWTFPSPGDPRFPALQADYLPAEPQGKVKVKSLRHVRLLAIPWTAAHQAPPSMGPSPKEGWEDPLEKGKATHSSILAWRISWTV